jgi:hypothetical protein
VRLSKLAVAATLAVFSFGAHAQNASVSKCESLKSLPWPGLVVTEAKIVPAGPVEPTPDGSQGPPPGTRVPEHCLFRGTINPRKGPHGEVFGIGIEMRLPTDWNGRFAFEGGGGLDGIQRPSYGSVWGTIRPPALARGFAVVATDGGHRSPSMTDAHFGLDQQARIDYAYNAVDKTTLVAKALIAQFYGRAPQHSYFVGCSNGGRQGLIVAQRIPLEFDGVVAGDPTMRLAWTNVDQAWNEIVLARAAPKDSQGQPIVSQALSAADLKLVSQAVVKQCDARDGLADGMVNDYPACHFDPAILTCKAEKTAGCLAPKQVTALKELMAGPHDSRGHALYAAFPYDSGIADPAFQHMHFGTSPTAVNNSADALLGFGSLKYYAMTPPDPQFDPMHFDFDRDTARIVETSKLNDADAAYLQSFASHGKLILYHGMSDQGLSPLDTAAWYDRLQSTTGGRTQDWARLFLVPGMTHCGGGPATDEFDMLTTIQSWVEEGHAPDRIVARGKTFPGVTRPLCPYPRIARYTGSDPKSEQSFSCVRSKAQAEQASLPTIDRPLPTTQTSHPFSASAYQKKPLDLDRQGYVESEYLVHGQASVYDRSDEGPHALAQGPYTTRILVRRPKDARRFSGTVIVEPMNPSDDMDLPIMWAESYQQFIADGDAWVGITIKPNTIAALKAFDPVRYAAVSMPNPRAAPACALTEINAFSRPTTPADESGLAWDMLSQIGLLLKSPASAAPLLGGSARRLYMTGQSQTAGYARLYASLFSQRVVGPDRKPLYDGYFYSGSPPWQVPINQCQKDLPAGDPRLITAPAGVPVVEIFTQGDMGTNVSSRRPDSDTPEDRFRRWEVAGAGHVDPWEALSFADEADVARAHGRADDNADEVCSPRGTIPTDFPVRYIFDAAWRALDAWVQHGIHPPHAPQLHTVPGSESLPPDRMFLVDAHGNALGGVRSPYIDVPTARWIGAKSGPFICLFHGYKIPMSHPQLEQLYKDHATYVGQVRASVSRLVCGKWLTAVDGAAIVREARTSAVP